ncbi:AI-2E family transporter [Pseudomonas segetis]|uniref:Predicted PurR-regulated permease PerM n=1 Tax=Pseudomonas segetis TaxID=298908 RepID=A0A238ZDS9_9PSED|nr:AI-2E family transporter [Pseudomonas segetis]SNR81507.1 Predicted PurR-regulated permease PerM [Pseudomonas segetis]
MSPTSPPELQFSRTLLDTFIRAALIAALVYGCYQVFHPFLSMMLWALILAVTLYPLHGMVKSRLTSRSGHAASLLVALAIAVLLIPVYFLGSSLTESVHVAIETVKSGSVHIPPPPAVVESWPVIGGPLYGFWTNAASDLTGVLQTVAPHLKGVSLGLLSKIAGVSVGFLIFIASLIIAGVIIAYGETGHRSAIRISDRIIGTDRSHSFITLCVATIRAVAQGVIGIAFIQMVVIGIGFIVMGIPGAGLLAMVVLLLGIMQLPLPLVTIPVIAFVFFTEGATLATIIFAIYTFIGGLLDNILKPILLGRGVDVPMPVILIGALGGMLAGGIIGLFIGPVVLAVGYKLFWQWVDAGQTPAVQTESVTQDTQ